MQKLKRDNKDIRSPCPPGLIHVWCSHCKGLAEIMTNTSCEMCDGIGTVWEQPAEDWWKDRGWEDDGD